MNPNIPRRTALGLIAASAGAGCALTPATNAARPNDADINEAFKHGVASGDPAATSVVIWTRLESDEDAAGVSWAVFKDADLKQHVASGETFAQKSADHTVKVVVENLTPGTRYYYRFSARGLASPIGRTMTLPESGLQKLGVALASCSNYTFGLFNAYDAIARDEQVDIVLHTGDYIYEYGAGEWGDDIGTRIGRAHEPRHEIVSLQDYRRRHAQYKSDAGSRAMHGAHPLIACWDDHESTNNPWMGGAQNHQPDKEGDWGQRRAASLQAYYEWMPIREPAPGRSRAEFWRSYRFGGLATLVTLETRHTARGEQVDYKLWFDKIKTKADRDAFMANVIGDPSRKMLSAGNEAELRSALGASKAAGEPWRLIGNASPIARMLVPDVAALGIDPKRLKGGETLGTKPDLFWTGRFTLPFYTDTWDGYPVAREAFYDLCRGVGVDDLIVLTGDSHSFWMNRLADAAGRPMGVELGTAGITSPGDFVETGWDAETAARLDRLFEEQLDEVVWTDNMHQGYVRLDLTPTRARAAFVAVDTVLSPDYRARVLKSIRIARSVNGLAFAPD